MTCAVLLKEGRGGKGEGKGRGGRGDEHHPHHVVLIETGDIEHLLPIQSVLTRGQAVYLKF